MGSEHTNDNPRIRRCLVGLTVVTGVVDAVSFLGLGHIFTANMTGNVVFLGFAMAGGEGLSAVRSVTALAAFAVGGVCGGRLVHARGRAPARSLWFAMWLECALLVIATAATVRATPELSSVAAYAVIVATAVAMGLRNAVVRSLAVPDLTTTVLTLTITGLAADSRLAGGDGPRTGRRLLAIAGMCGGALGGGAVLRAFGITAALGVSALLVFGLALSARGLARPDGPAPDHA